jgi:hypothetical protein
MITYELKIKDSFGDIWPASIRGFKTFPDKKSADNFCAAQDENARKEKRGFFKAIKDNGAKPECWVIEELAVK